MLSVPPRLRSFATKGMGNGGSRHVAVGLIEVETNCEPLYLVGRRSDGGKSGHDIALRCEETPSELGVAWFPHTVIGGKLEDGERITDALWNTTTELNLRSLYALSEHTKCTHIAKTWRARPLPRDERRDRRPTINNY